MPSTLPRQRLAEQVHRLLRHFPVTLLLGPRQCGKTTLAHQLAGTTATYFDLEDPATPLRPEAAGQVLAPLRGLVVIDEFQRQPELFELLRVLADRKPRPSRFLILGSASPGLVRGVSESLAGRVGYCEMSGFDLAEIEPARQTPLWTRGGYPRSFLARSEAESVVWRQHFVQTFIERDLPQLGVRVSSQALRRFLTMVAHYHGQIWNAADLARSMGVGENAVRHYLDILSGAFMVRQLPPWFENIGKRLVKAPRVYVRDSGILHLLLGLRSRHEVLAHPKLGASWEGFALDQIIRLLSAERDAHFYRTHAGAELDLLIVRHGKRYGFEFKYGDAPVPSRSMHIALADLGLEHIYVVYPGDRAYALAPRISALPISGIPALAVERKWR